MRTPAIIIAAALAAGGASAAAIQAAAPAPVVAHRGDIVTYTLSAADADQLNGPTCPDTHACFNSQDSVNQNSVINNGASGAYAKGERFPAIVIRREIGGADLQVFLGPTTIYRTFIVQAPGFTPGTWR